MQGGECWPEPVETVRFISWFTLVLLGMVQLPSHAAQSRARLSSQRAPLAWAPHCSLRRGLWGAPGLGEQHAGLTRARLSDLMTKVVHAVTSRRVSSSCWEGDPDLGKQAGTPTLGCSPGPGVGRPSEQSFGRLLHT